MDPITESQIKSSFVNCSKGEAKRLHVPKDLDTQPWDDLDFLGWGDPSLRGRCYLAVPGTVTGGDADTLTSVAMRFETGGSRKSQMCTICLTTHASGDVALMTARKTGESGRRGNTVGTYMCGDLACSLYARRKRTPALGNQYREDTSVDERVERVRTNLAAFLARIED